MYSFKIVNEVKFITLLHIFQLKLCIFCEVKVGQDYEV